MQTFSQEHASPEVGELQFMASSEAVDVLIAENIICWLDQI
jgi:hypothetical protein